MHNQQQSDNFEAVLRDHNQQRF
jgi:hypothetical protein